MAVSGSCLDPKDLNKAIKQEHHPIPTLDDITPRLHGSTLFSKLDAKQGYWNVKLDEESTLLTTFNTHKGRYKFLHMPFGLKMSQDVFQKKIDQTYEKCKGRSRGAPATAPMASRQLISKIIQSTKTIEKPRAAAMPPSEPQPALPTPVPPSPQRIPSVPKPHPVIQENDRPHKPTGSGNNNKVSPKVSFSKPLAQCKFLTSHRTPMRRQPHCAGPTE